MHRIAIIGAGFCGLAIAWHLLQHPSHPSMHVTIFDAKGVGGGASGIAAGLLHPFSGAHAKLNRMGREGVAATRHLLQVSSNALGKSVASTSGILRLAVTEAQHEDFALCAAKYPEDIEWLSSEQCQTLFPYLTWAPGIWIKGGEIVNAPLYLEGLWLACQQLGAQLEKRFVEDLSELEAFDIKIIAAGAASRLFPEIDPFALNFVKGQVLELAWPSSLPPLPFALNSHAYVLMNSPSSCIAGATFERRDLTDTPNLAFAQADIMPKVTEMLPALADAPILKCQAGLRVTTPSHLPLLEKVNEQTWVLTGMGSKGLLYHALMAEKLANQICSMQ